MQITKQNLTIIIVTVKSQNIIDDCLKSIDPDIKKIIVENSSNHEFTKYLKTKYKNIECYLTGKNLGMGAGNNFGIKKSNTRYVMVLNPDTILRNDTLSQIFEISKNLEFAILSPLSDNKDYPNYKKILLAMRTSKTNLKDIAHATRPFFFELDGYEEKGVKKFLNESLETLTFALEVLSKLTEWNETELDMALIKVRDYFNLPIPKVNQPMRIALVGSTVSPSLGLTLELFGKEKSLKRIQKAIDFIS